MIWKKEVSDEAHFITFQWFEKRRKTFLSAFFISIFETFWTSLACCKRCDMISWKKHFYLWNCVCDQYLPSKNWSLLKNMSVLHPFQLNYDVSAFKHIMEIHTNIQTHTHSLSRTHTHCDREACHFSPFLRNASFFRIQSNPNRYWQNKWQFGTLNELLNMFLTMLIFILQLI